MKNILLIGKLLVNIPSPEKLVKKDVHYFVAHDIATVQEVFKHNKVIDTVIMGAGIELEKRLDIVRYIFSTSDTVTIHMKDYATGPEGFVPFINNVLAGMIQDEE
ncbi:hypothetical protein FRZ67_06125 [Panacibacter ginsenosidivorans]|uniref:Uncharacterized protein n=1 Tax=Panacibacter ginsenosidivorans TaxID=1813871 RepID=A0A5B8V6I6_9BACT|nr:hypothetical protein [Panacibacter ginsenosidivorans]QEC66892.1 hypothetical protein FRZ67_06125 [Panacibacter ginsenosidivorans]